MAISPTESGRWAASQNGQGSPQPRDWADVGPYTRIPKGFFGSGMAARLGQSAALLFVALCDHANRNGKNIFKVSDRTLAADTRISTRSIYAARKRLQEFGCLTCARGEGQSYEYSIPEKFEWKWTPTKERRRQKGKPRGEARGEDTEFLIAERAAIMEYDGNLPREMAERLARQGSSASLRVESVAKLARVAETHLR